MQIKKGLHLLFDLWYTNVRDNYILERYRSGHNGAVLKTVRVQAHVGSNPTLSAIYDNTPIPEEESFFFAYGEWDENGPLSEDAIRHVRRPRRDSRNCLAVPYTATRDGANPTLSAIYDNTPIPEEESFFLRMASGMIA